MAEIDVKFMKGNQRTAKAIGNVIKAKPTKSSAVRRVAVKSKTGKK